MDLGEVLSQVKGLINDQASLQKSAIEDLKKTGAVPSETKEKIEAMAKDCERLTNAYNDAKAEQDTQKRKLSELEAKQADFEKFGGGKKDEYKSLGQLFVESEEYKEAIARKDGRSRKYKMDNLWEGVKDFTTANTAATLTEPMRLAGIQQIPNVPLTVRALLPVGRTAQNMIEYVKENVFTNSAGPQYSPTSPATYDGAKKNKSDITWTLQTRAVVTIAHYMKASRQILDDAPMLQSEINNRLLYGLALEEEAELLNGDGTGGKLLGLIPQAADYDTGLTVAVDSKIDTIRHALLQVTLSKYLPTAIVLAPKDWHDMELIKTQEGGANKGSYVLSNPAASTNPRLWGYRVVESLSMTAGRFLVGNFATGAQIFDRQDASIEIARQNEDDFIRNMVSILAEERLALAVYNGNSFVEGAF